MHSARLDTEWFSVEHNGTVGRIESIVPDCNQYDRFGIVVHHDMGAAGAGLLIQGVTAELFRARRAAGLRDTYPEIYAFHVGRDHGDLSPYDFWPYNKEVVLSNDPTHVIHAINERAITRLAVPAGESQKVDYVWPELISFEERIRTVIGYSPDGAVSGGDVTIRASAELVEANTMATFDMLSKMNQWRNDETADVRRWVGHVGTRLGVVDAKTVELARTRHLANIHKGETVETYLKADIQYALQRLVP